MSNHGNIKIYHKMFMDKDLIEDKLYKLIQCRINSVWEKLMIGCFVLHYLTTYTHFVTGVGSKNAHKHGGKKIEAANYDFE